MLYSSVTPNAKRKHLRAMLTPGAARQFPGTFTPLSAPLIQEKGFDGLYISGAVLAHELGMPDIGLTSLNEVAQRAGQIARVSDLPAIVDADTGFGEPMNVARTIQELENAGLAACHIEDQVNPKRCGHLAGKEVVAETTAIQRIQAAVTGRRDPDFMVFARTDIRAVDTLEATIHRAQALVAAGADAIFPEALKSLDEFSAVCAALDVPVLANMTEFGQSELFTREQLAQCGIALIIYPVTALRSAMGAIENTLDVINEHGTQQPAVSDMMPRARVYELVDYEAYNHFDQNLFSCEVPGEYT